MTAFATLPQNHPSVNGSRLFGHVILRAVSEKSGISLEELTGPSQRRTIAWPRQLAMYLMRLHCPHLSYRQIGRMIGGRDHSTAQNAEAVIPGRLKENLNEARMIKRCNIFRSYYYECGRLRRIHAEVLEELGLDG